MIVVVDYGRGNLFSLGRALEQVGAVYRVTAEPEAILSAHGIVLPGVGTFRHAMRVLTKLSLVEPIRQAAAQGTAILGICLGMQLLFSRSTEFGDNAGLDINPGVVDLLPEGDGDEGSCRIPNVGWRRIAPRARHPLNDAFVPGDMFYFTHSYVPYPEDSRDVLATMSINGIDAAVLVCRGNVFGCQFHPEKSGPVGLHLLKRYVDLVEGGRNLRQSA